MCSPLSLALALTLSLSLSRSHSLALILALALSLSLSLSLYLSFSLSLSLSLSLPQSANLRGPALCLSWCPGEQSTLAYAVGANSLAEATSALVKATSQTYVWDGPAGNNCWQSCLGVQAPFEVGGLF